MFNSRVGRNVLHLLTYGLAMGVLAVLDVVAGWDFGEYTVMVGLAIGFVADYIRKRFTAI